MIGLLTRGVCSGTRFGVCVAGALRPLIDLAARPPMVPPRYRPGLLVAHLAEQGRDQRRRAAAAARHVFHRLVAAVTAEVLDQLDLTALICERIDVDAVLGRPEPAEPGQAAGVPMDPAISEWVDRVFRHRAPANDDSGEPRP